MSRSVGGATVGLQTSRWAGFFQGMFFIPFIISFDYWRLSKHKSLFLVRETVESHGSRCVTLKSNSVLAEELRGGEMKDTRDRTSQKERKRKREDVLMKSRRRRRRKRDTWAPLRREGGRPQLAWAAASAALAEGWTEGLWFSSGSRHLKASYLPWGAISSCSWRLCDPQTPHDGIVPYPCWFGGFSFFVVVFLPMQKRHRFLLELLLLRGKIIHSKHCGRGDGNDWVTLFSVQIWITELTLLCERFRHVWLQVLDIKWRRKLATIVLKKRIE